MADTIHILAGGRALCDLPGLPNEWGAGHRWIGYGDHDAATCRDCLVEARIAGALTEGLREAAEPAAFVPVILETPYAGDVEANLTYLRACMRDCLQRGEAPFASHGLYTQPGVLSDADPAERELGIRAGFAWRACASKTVVYTDRGVSRGMEQGIDHARALGHEVERRQLEGAAEQGDPGWPD